MAIDLATIPDWARRPVSRPAGHRPRVVLVGPCAGGKSTLAAALLGDGYDAVALAQEHSEVPHLWALSRPDALIYLAVTLAVIRQRRAAPNWPAAIYQRQLRRLTLALAHATVYIDTDRRQPAGVLAVARAGLLAAGVVVAKDLVADGGRN
ncbi:MAG: hypothetical protein IT340_15705 [Chloroflexi bacterium]|nr:hypothetical protein [Chloroflexota bacterium]